MSNFLGSVQYDHIKDGILEIPAQTMPWVEYVVEYNKIHNNKVKFVIFRYPAGEWAGGNEKTLPEISGIKEATFCHNGCFFARARMKCAIIEMCHIAMNKA